MPRANSDSSPGPLAPSDGSRSAKRGGDGSRSAKRGGDGSRSAKRGGDGSRSAKRGGDGSRSAKRRGDGSRSAKRGGDRPELLWPGKYTEAGALNQPDPPVPEQVVVERVPGPASGPGGWRNRLYLGDNLLAMTALLSELEGQFGLIYIDPPFATGGTFHHRVALGEGGRGAQVLTQRAYRDYFGAGARSYLQVMACRLRLMHRLLSEQGSLYLHCDWRVDAGLRLLLDEIFGAENFRSKLIWKKDAVGKGAKKIARHWPRTFDEILVYSKSERAYYEPQLGALGPVQLAEFRYADADGRRFKRTTLGDYSEKSVLALEAAGRIYTSSSGKKYKKYYLDEYTLLQDALIVDVPGFGVATSAAERLGYDTQKPEALLERIVRASSPAGGLVGDFFCGSGTTLAVAARLGRRFVGCDLGRLAVHTARKRLLTAGAGFDVLRLGPPDPADPNGTVPASARVAPGEQDGTLVALLIGGGEAHGAKWADYIDAWAVDWAYEGVFVSRWSACRMPGRPRHRVLPLRSGQWPASQSSVVAVLVLDVFGRETLLVLGSGDAGR